MFGDDATGSNIREPQGDGRLTDPNALQLLAGALWKSGIGKKLRVQILHWPVALS